MQAVDRERRGLAHSSYQIAFQLSWAISALLGSLLIRIAGYAPVFIAAVNSLLFIALFWLRFRDS